MSRGGATIEAGGKGGGFRQPHLFQILVFFIVLTPPTNSLTPHLQIRGAALAYEVKSKVKCHSKIYQ